MFGNSSLGLSSGSTAVRFGSEKKLFFDGEFQQQQQHQQQQHLERALDGDWLTCSVVFSSRIGSVAFRRRRCCYCCCCCCWRKGIRNGRNSSRNSVMARRNLRAVGICDGTRRTNGVTNTLKIPKYHPPHSPKTPQKIQFERTTCPKERFIFLGKKIEPTLLEVDFWIWIGALYLDGF